MWTVPFDNITKILEVRSPSLELETLLADKIAMKDILLYGTSLLDFYRLNKNLDLALLSPNLPSARAPTRHILHNSALYIVYHHIRYRDRTTMYPCPDRLGALGWRAPWEMHQPERRCLGVGWREHCSRLDRNNPAHQRGDETCNEPSPQVRSHAYVSRRRLVSTLHQYD
jgi:hypothetical protein